MILGSFWLLPKKFENLYKYISHEAKFDVVEFCGRTSSICPVHNILKVCQDLASSSLLLKALIRPCLFVLPADLLNFLIGILVRVLSRVPRKWITCETKKNFQIYLTTFRSTSYTIILRRIGYMRTQCIKIQDVIAWLVEWTAAA